MIETRRAFEAEVLTWKGVTSRPMMGCLCYFYNRKFIGFLVTNGIVLMKLSEKDRKEVKEKFGGKPFEMAGQTGRLWVTPLNRPKDVRSIMPFVRKRYEEVSSSPPRYNATRGETQILPKSLAANDLAASSSRISRLLLPGRKAQYMKLES